MTEPLLEVEVKYPLADPDDLRVRLLQHGASRLGVRTDSDRYFAAPDRDFAQTDEALRVRRMGLTNVVTYKGPRRPSPTKTRPEIEVPLADGTDVADDMEKLLIHLGYRPVTVVQKEREEYRWAHGNYVVQITLDDVAEVGHYAELEIVTPAAEVAAAEAAVLSAAAVLGLSNPERRSYLALLLAKRAGG